MNATEPAHIDRDPARCGGKPCIAGTRIRVWDVHVWHELRGWSPAEIIAQFPQLTLADIYAALADYHDHREEIDREMQEAKDFADRMKALAGPSPLDHLRAQDALNDPVPSR